MGAVDVVTDLDMSMLDASEWQTAPTETHDRVRIVWRDRGEPGDHLHYIDTGARSADRSAWLEARRSGIGASDAALLMGESRWGDAGTVYARKAAPSDDASAEWLAWGLALEEPIAQAYASPRYAGREVARDGRLLRSREHPWAVCTLDAWTVIDGTQVPLELKTDSDRYGYAWDGGVPADYVWQLHHQMLVTGAHRASIACLLAGSRLVWADVERDESRIRRLVRAGSALWTALERGEMPETADHDALASAYPSSDGREIELSGVEWMRADIARCEAAAGAARAEEEKRAIDARIKRAMGRAEVARLDDGTEYRWTTQRDGRRVLRRKEARA